VLMQSNITTRTLLIGCVLVALVQIFSRYVLKSTFRARFNMRIIPYIIWLAKEVLISAMSVVRMIWSRLDKIQPLLSTVKTIQITDEGRVLYANSITLTPGTFTVDIKDDGEFLVHSLMHKKYWDDTMDKKIQEVIK
jgi:multicomponent Na+:H+ antiporter subunit E